MEIKIACAQAPLAEPETFQQWAALIERRVDAAADEGARILTFAEYGSLELASVLRKDGAEPENPMDDVRAIQRFLPDFVSLFSRLAATRRLVIVAPSFPVEVGVNFVNRAFVCGPEKVDHQDKVHMTRFENEWMTISGASELKVFSFESAVFAVSICYDIEFPMQIRALVDSGAELILAPSATDTNAGYQRVLLGARARALENQCYVAQAPLAGKSRSSQIVDVNTGCAGIYGPVDIGFPDDGIIALGQPGEDWLIRAIDFEKTRAVRENGQVKNRASWLVKHDLCASHSRL